MVYNYNNHTAIIIIHAPGGATFLYIIRLSEIKYQYHGINDNDNDNDNYNIFIWPY